MPRKGENIRKRQDGRWEGRYISSRLPNGKAKYSSVYGNSYAQVKEKLAKEKASETTAKSDAVLFSDALKMWIESNSYKLKDSTVLKYSHLIEMHIVPAIGRYYVNEICSDLINSFISFKTNNGVSVSYIKTMIIIIKSAVNFSVSKGFCSPIQLDIQMPKSWKSEVSILSDKDQYMLENYARNNTDETTIGILLALYGGLRVGEVCALKWDNINFSQKTIKIDSTVSKTIGEDGKVELALTMPKTENSLRTIPISNMIYDPLKSAKNNAASNFVVSKTADFTNPRTYEYRFHNVLKRSGVADVNFHTLRHTFATNCVDSGVDIKTLSEILGHSSVSTTLGLYVHPTINQKRKQLDKISRNIA